MKEKRYITFTEVGYGHEEPIEFTSTPDKALERAYEIYIEAEENEDRIQDEPEELRAPRVYEVSEVKENQELFTKMCVEYVDAENAKREAQYKEKQEARAAALSKLSDKEKRALGL